MNAADLGPNSPCERKSSGSRLYIVWGVMALLTATIVFGLCSRGKGGLEQYRAQLRSQGEKLSYDEWARGFPPGNAIVLPAITDAGAYLSLKHHGIPPNLPVLSPEFSPQPGRDPMTRQPLRYSITPQGKWVLYSIGENGVDDGGDATPTNDGDPGLWESRDALWPTPAIATQEKSEPLQLNNPPGTKNVRPFWSP